MENIEYSEVIGKKFDKNGEPLTIPGNTFLCFVDMDSDVGKHINRVKQMLNESKFYRKYIQLPQSSYHMTMIEGVIPIFSANVWTTKFSRDCPLGIIDAHFIEQYNQVKKPTCLDMICTGINFSEHGCSLKLKPKDEETDSKIRKFRDDIASSCGLYFPNHETYQFHISLAYLREKLNTEEKIEQREMKRKIENYIKENFSTVELAQPQLTFFDTMFEFRLKR